MLAGRLWLVGCVFLAFSWAALAQSNTIIFPITNAWRYEQTVSLDGTNWPAPAFNDSAWPNGIGLLHVENNAAVTPRNTPLTIGRTAYYFRTHFHRTNSAAGLGLVFSNLVDDGAVFYLNGHEIQRLRMPAAPQIISYASLAPTASVEAVYDTFTISGDSLTNLVFGDNVLAVEVHQNTAGSTDIVFGSALSVVASSGAFTFTEQPTNSTVLDGRPAVLRVATSASVAPALQWYKDGAPIPGATWSTVTSVPGHAGSYWAVASNSTMMLTSAVAVITVLPDNTAPVVMRAIAQKNLTNIVVDLTEPVRPQATNLANYRVVKTSSGANDLTIVNVTLSNETTLILTTLPRENRVNYSLLMTNVVDWSSASNQVSSAPVPLKYVTDLLSIDTNATWKYEQSGFCPPITWSGPDFDDSTWQTGGPLFFASLTGTAILMPVPIGVTLNATNLFRSGQVITYYFRTEFDLPGLSTNALLLRHIIDDGTVLHLNSQPIYSLRMNAAPTCQSLATGNPGTPAFEPPLSQAPFSISNSAMPGMNLIAAEVHQVSSNSPDVAFAVSLEALIDEFIPGLSLTLPAFTTNGAGVLVNAGRVALTEATGTNVVVALNSSAASILSAPPTVTVLAGTTNVFFNLTVSSTPGPAGPRRVSVGANAGGFVAATKKTVVLDSVPAPLALALPGSVVEGGGPVTGRVEFSTPLAQDVTVVLTSTLPGTVGVPPTILIPAGQTSAVFQVVIPSNNVLEGTRTVTVTAHVAGWVDGVAMVNVLDKPDSYRALSLATRDLAYDPVTQRIYASLPGSAPTNGNQIVPIAPETGSIEAGFSMGGEPGKLLVAPGGGKLYASVETNRLVRRADLLSRTMELSFPLETNPPANLVIEDFELLPGSPNPVAVLRLQNNFFATLAIYDEGVRRTNVAPGGDDSAQEIIEVGGDGSSIYVQNFGFQGFRRLTVDAQGASAAYVDYSITTGQWTRDWKAVESRLFGGDGVIIEPLIPKVVATVPNIPVNSPMCYDAPRGRFFYLAQSNTVWVLRSFDSRTLAPLGSLSLSGVSGIPSSLIRAGDDGFAFRTDANQVFLLRTTLTGYGVPADLSVELTSSAPSILAGSNVTYTISVTNRGIGSATNVILSALLPSTGTILTSSVPYLSYSAGSPGVAFSLGALTAGASTNIVLTLRVDAAGLVALSASVLADAVDPVLSNNFAALTVVATLDPNRNGAGLVAFSASDIAYDALRHRLYASTTPDVVAVINPDTGEIVNSLVAGPNPTRLALSSNGQFLYVAVSNGTAIKRMDLTTATPDLLFPTVTFSDFAILPNDPHGVVVASPGFVGYIAVYDDSARRAQGMVDSAGASFLEFAGSPSVVYGNGTALSGYRRYRTLQISAAGVSEAAWNEGVPYNLGDFEFGGGFFYATTGDILIPASGAVVEQLNGLGSDSLVELAINSGRIFFVSRFGSEWRFIVYDAAARSQIGSLTISNVVGNPRNLIRWGTNGLAFNTSGNQLFLFKGSPLPHASTTDLVLTQRADANTAMVGSNVSLIITVSNAGPSAASGVVVAVRFDSLAGFVNATGAPGSYTQTNNLLVWSVGALPANAAASFTYTILPASAGTLSSVASATSTAIEGNHGNNIATNRLGVILGAQPLNSVGEVRVTTSTLAYDPVSGRLFAAVPTSSAVGANSLLPINPVTAALGTPILLTAEPTHLGITDDGQFAYVSLYAESAVQRVNLFSNLPELKVDFGEGGLAAVSDLSPIPGAPHSFVMINNEPPIYGVPPYTVVLDNAIPRPNGAAYMGQLVVVRSNLLVGYNTLVPSSTYSVAITSTGLVVSGSANYLVNGVLKSSGGLVFTDSGKIVNPDSLTLITTLPVSGLHEPDAANGRVFFLTLVSGTWTLRVFDLGTFTEIGSMPVPGILGTPHSLVRCGTDRLAVGTTGGQVMLVRTSLAVVDADGDGLADIWEMAFFHSTNAPNGGAAQDFDGDGVPNLGEYLNGTDPTDASNAFRISRVSLSGGTVTLRFHGVTGIRYQLEQSPTVSGPWSGLGSVVTGQGFGVVLTNNPPLVSPQFYRLLQVP